MKENRQNDKQWSTKHYRKQLMIWQHEPQPIGNCTHYVSANSLIVLSDNKKNMKNVFIVYEWPPLPTTLLLLNGTNCGIKNVYVNIGITYYHQRLAAGA